MSEEREEHQDWNSNISKFQGNEFYNAIRDEDLERMEEMTKKYDSNYLLKIQDGTPSEVFCKGRAIRPLHLAASYRRVNSMRILLSAGADPEMRSGQTHPVHTLNTKHPAYQFYSVKQASHIRMNNYNNSGGAPHFSGIVKLDCVCSKCLISFLVYLQQFHFPCVCHRDGLGRTTLHLVITSWPSFQSTWPKPGSKLCTVVTSRFTQAEACLRLLCDHGVNINAEVDGKIRQTALHLAVHYTALSAIHTLASYGADINAVASSGMTPLHMAAGILRKDIIASLIKEGADINMGVKNSGNTPLHIAAVATAMKTAKTPVDISGCISELVKHGAQINATNKAGMTPLQEACSIGDNELVDLLLRYGANINDLSKTGENCLFLFLNRRANVRKKSLLVKLFSLISPLTVYNHKGLLPSTLNLPCFFKQTQQLLKLIQQPRSLQDICKRAIYLRYVQDKRDELRKVLPESVYNFVFNYWEDSRISFETDSDGDQDSFNSLIDMAPL